MARDQKDELRFNPLGASEATGRFAIVALVILRALTLVAITIVALSAGTITPALMHIVQRL